MKDFTIPTSKIKVPSFKGIKNAVGNALTTAGDAVVNAKTPSLKELGDTANDAQKSVRHTIASIIDSE